jgi:proteasome lid subunit RPN8/RPN11
MSNNAEPTDFVDKSTIYIQPEAYLKMKKHCLRFASANINPNDFGEVMGMLFGRLEDGEDPNVKDVYVIEAAPVSHGNTVEVTFSMKDYANIAILDQKYAARGLFCVGWYHSHPGLSCFFSSVDKLNQLGFQSQNPSAIGLVFDHERFNNLGDQGFDAYRLDDPMKAYKSGYHKVNYVVEDAGYLLDHILELKALIDDHQRGLPIIMELGENLDVFGNISLPDSSEVELHPMAIETKQVLKELKFQTSNKQYKKIEKLLSNFSEWASDLTTSINNINGNWLDELKDFKNVISEHFNDTQGWLQNYISEKSQEIQSLLTEDVD